MSCRFWSDTWIAVIYGESSPEEARELADHVQTCARCRESVDELRATRELLREHAPEVPASRPILVLGPRARSWQPAWAFAAGLGAAAIAFAAGTWTAKPGSLALPTDPAPLASESASLSTTPPRPASETAESVTIAQVLERLDRIEAESAAAEQGAGGVQGESLRVELERLERRLRREYRADLEQLAGAFAASERRTGAWLDDARDAIQLLALRQDSRITER